VHKITKTFQTSAIWAAIGLGASIPIATSLDSLLSLLVLVGGLLSGIFWQQRQQIKQNPVAIAALLLFALLAIGCFYDMANLQNALKILNKYSDLIFIALFLPLFADSKHRQYGWYCFLAAMTLTLALSYLIWFGVFEGTRFFTDRLPDNPVVFKLHITHGILMAFSCYIFTIKAMNSTGKWRLILSALALLAAFNVLFMVQGRTGYLVFAGLAIYLTAHALGRKGIALASIGIVAIALAGYFMSARLHNRVDLAAQEYSLWHPKQGHNEASSIGTRMDYYSNTIKIIAKHPILGVGTGNFEQAYQQEIVNTASAPSNNPHNQFLLFTAQIGLIGLVAFLLLLTTQWKLARRLASEEDYLLARGLVITIGVGCLFNSLLLDHSEGLFFAWASGLLFAGLRGNVTVPVKLAAGR
jgi:O-antigen ligase